MRKAVFRVTYERRYWNGSAYAFGASRTILRRDIDRVSGLSQRFDVPIKNRITSSNVTLVLKDKGYTWLPSNTANGVWRKDATATTGYDPINSRFTISYGYVLEDETEEWLSMFVGRVVDDPKFDSKSGTVSIPLVGQAESLLEAGDAQRVCTTLTDQATTPATGDASNTIFAMLKSVWQVTNVRFNAVTKTQGDAADYTLNDLNDAEVAASIVATAGSIPGAGHVVLWNGKQWYRDKSIKELAELICTQVGIGSSDREIEEPIFTGVDQSRTLQDAADWSAGTLTNAEGLSLDGWLRRRWFLYDSGAATTNWTSHATPITSDGTRVAFGGNSTNGKVATGYVHDRESGTFEMKIRQVVGAPFFMMVMPFGYRFGTEYGFYIDTDAGGSTIGMVDSTRSSIGSGSSSLTPGVEHTIRYTLAPASGGSRAATLYVDGVQIATASLPASYFPDTFSVWNSNPGSLTGDSIEMRDVYFSNAVLTPAASSVETADMPWRSVEIDMLAAPTQWLPMEVVKTLNGGTLTVKTDVAAASGGPYDGAVAVDGTNTPTSALKRYAKVELTSTIGSFALAPEVDKVVLNWRGSSLFIKSADFTGLTCLEAIAELAKLGGMYFGTKGDGKFFMRNRTPSSEPVLVLSQRTAVLEVLDYQPGYRDVRNVGQVRYGQSGTAGYYYAEYGATEASEASPTSAARFGERPISLDLQRFIFSNNASVATAIARKLYTDNYLPKRRLRLRCRIIPQLDTADTVQVSFHDSPLIERAIFGDPLQTYPVTGPNSRTLARDIIMQVVGHQPDVIRSESVLDLEEVL